MSAALEALATGLADRLWTRLAARDRVDALDEHASGPTSMERMRHEPPLLEELVEAGIDELLGALADAGRRAQLRALCAGISPSAGDDLARAGLAVGSWSGGEMTASEAGLAASAVLDELARQVTAALLARLAAGPR